MQYNIILRVTTLRFGMLGVGGHQITNLALPMSLGSRSVYIPMKMTLVCNPITFVIISDSPRSSLLGTDFSQNEIYRDRI